MARLGVAPSDDRSSKSEPNRAETDRGRSLATFVSSSRRDHFVIAVARLLEPQLVMHSDIIVYRNLTLNDVMYIVETGYVVLFGADPTRTERVVVCNRAGKGCEIPNFKGSYLGRFPLVLADFSTSDHLSERSRP